MENKEFFKDLKSGDLQKLLESIDKKIEELNKEEQEELTKEILSGNTQLIPKKVDKLYNLSAVYPWAIDDIQKIVLIFKKDNTLKEKYKEEYFALNVFNNIYIKVYLTHPIKSQRNSTMQFFLCVTI